VDAGTSFVPGALVRGKVGATGSSDALITNEVANEL